MEVKTNLDSLGLVPVSREYSSSVFILQFGEKLLGGTKYCRDFFPTSNISLGGSPSVDVIKRIYGNFSVLQKCPVCHVNNFWNVRTSGYFVFIV